MDDVADGGTGIWPPPAEQWQRVPALMRQDATLPMDLADASLVLPADHLGHGRIFSTDVRDFGVDRWKNHRPFTNLLETTP